MVQRVLGDTAKAEQSYLKAIEVHRETGNAVHLASVYGKLANLYGQLERNEAALELYQQAITSEREHGASAGLGLLLCNLGILYNAMDRPAACEASLRESLQILGRYSNQRLLSAAEGALAQHLLDAGRIEEAEEYAQSSLDRALASQDPVGAALVRGTLAACRRKQGTLEESEAMLRASVAELQEMNDIAGVGSSRCSLAITLHLQGRKQDALNEWNTGHEALIQSTDMLSLKPLLAEWDEVRASS
jgi:tetratricopeptide (TPR) repeat protein